jgi:hypothetical protein
MKSVSVFIATIVLVLLCPYPGNAQGNFWRQVLNSNEITSITEDDRGFLFAAGARGEVLESMDFGDNWSKITAIGLPLNYPISWISSMSSTKLICRLYNKGLYSSTDDGVHWSPTGDSSLVARFFRIRKSPQGYLFGENETTLYRSTNEGITWTKIFDDTTSSLTPLCFDSSNHVLIVSRNRIKRSGVDDSVWTDLGFSASGTVLSSLSTAPNGDVFAGASISFQAALFVYRDSKWTLLSTLPYGQAILDVTVDSTGVIYGLGFDGPTIRSINYGASFSKSINGNVQCTPSSYFLSHSGYLFAPEDCGILRSVSRLGDTILHFPTSTISQCISRVAGMNLNQIRSMALKDGYIYFSNGGISRISTSGGAVGNLTSLPEPYGGPFEIVGDTCYSVNYDLTSPTMNWSKISKISISKGGLAQENKVLETKRIVDLKHDDSCLYWLCASTTENGNLVGDGRIQKLNLYSQIETDLADSLFAADNIVVQGDSIYFGERGERSAGLKAISKIGSAVRTLADGACGAIAADDLDLAYFRTVDSSLYIYDRTSDTTIFLLRLEGSSVKLAMDDRSIYCVSERQCDQFSSLLRISRVTHSAMVLDDSISCNPYFCVDSTVVYVSDDLQGGRVRQVCNPQTDDGNNVIIPSNLDFGRIHVGQESAKRLPVENLSSTDITIYAATTDGLFSIYPPSLSIPAYSEASFVVYCNVDKTDVQDEAIFSANGPIPFATTLLTALGPWNAVNATPAPDSAIFHYSDNRLQVKLGSGPYLLYVTDELGRVLRQWDGNGDSKSELFSLDLPSRLLFISLNQAGERNTMKVAKVSP